MSEWYFSIDGQPSGPYSEKDMLFLIRDGFLTPNSLVWNSEFANDANDWVAASKTELNLLFTQDVYYEPAASEVQNEFTKLKKIDARDHSEEADSNIVNSRDDDIQQSNHQKYFDKFKKSNSASIKQSENQVSKIIDLGLFQSIILIILSISVYFFLKKYLLFNEQHANFVARSASKAANSVVEFFLLKPYRAILLSAIVNALKSCAIPILVYVIYLRIVARFQRFEKASPWIAYLAMPVLAYWLYRLYHNFSPKILNPAEAIELTQIWFWSSINTCSMAVIFGLWFHSRKLSSAIAVGVLVILNIVVNMVLNTIETALSFIPFVSAVSKIGFFTMRIVINSVELAQVFMLLAIGIIIKKFIDYFFYKRYGLVVKKMS
jgi:hypothetical protein